MCVCVCVCVCVYICVRVHISLSLCVTVSLFFLSEAQVLFGGVDRARMDWLDGCGGRISRPPPWLTNALLETATRPPFPRGLRGA